MALNDDPFVTTTIELLSEIRINYLVSDKYFILTITFACLILVLMAVLITIMVLYKRKRREFRNFLMHKQRKI